MRILLVDDEKKIVTVLKAYLQQEGFQVSTAINGLIALTMFKENPFDLLILDLMLPGYVRNRDLPRSSENILRPHYHAHR